MKTNFLSFFLYANADRKTYKDNHRAIANENILVLTPLCFFAGLVFLIFTVIYAIKQDIPRIILNSSYMVLTTGMFIFSRHLPKFSSHLSNVASYTSLSFVLIYGIILECVINREAVAVSYMVLLVGVPLLMVDVPWHIMVMTGGFTVVFVIFSYIFKGPGVNFEADMHNAIFFYILSCFVIPFLVRSKITGILRKIQLEADRDMDGLTQLFHRGAARRKIDEMLKAMPEKAALFMIDIDDFKGINDRYGHMLGDRIICDVAHCIKTTAPDKSVAARYGGDEFILFINDIKDDSEATDYATRLIESVRALNDDNSTNLLERNISISVGIAMYPHDSVMYENLMAKADEALYIAKRNGKNCYATL